MEQTEEQKILAKITNSKGEIDVKTLAKVLAEIQHYAVCAYDEHIRQGNY